MSIFSKKKRMKEEKRGENMDLKYIIKNVLKKKFYKFNYDFFKIFFYFC